jgi:TRAP-type C4-dicarboxylate transport system permease small subunit
MKKDNITRFIQAHKQHIDDNGFSEKLAAQLKYYPQARKASVRKTCLALVVPCCSLLAVWLILLLGGWQVVLDALLKSAASAAPLTSIPYVLIAITLMSLLALPVRLKDSL